MADRRAATTVSIDLKRIQPFGPDTLLNAVKRPRTDAGFFQPDDHVEGVAALLRCSTRSVRRGADSGKIPRPIRVLSLVRWRVRTGDPMAGLLDWTGSKTEARRAVLHNGGRGDEDETTRNGL